MWLLWGTTDLNPGPPYSKGETFQDASVNPRVVSISSVLILPDSHKKVPSVSQYLYRKSQTKTDKERYTHTEAKLILPSFFLRPVCYVT